MSEWRAKRSRPAVALRPASKKQRAPPPAAAPRMPRMYRLMVATNNPIVNRWVLRGRVAKIRKAKPPNRARNALKPQFWTQHPKKYVNRLNHR